MGPLSAKQSAIERRLKELKKESELVRGDIKTLTKAIRNPDDLPSMLPKLKTVRDAEPAVRPPSRRDPVRARPEAPAPMPTPDGEEDLFTAVPRGGEPGKIQVPGAVPYGMPPPVAEAARKPAAKDDRFANYFSSGNFLGAKPLRQEKNVQRNKAIFMMIIVVIVTFSVYHLLFK